MSKERVIDFAEKVTIFTSNFGVGLIVGGLYAFAPGKPIANVAKYIGGTGLAMAASDRTARSFRKNLFNPIREILNVPPADLDEMDY